MAESIMPPSESEVALILALWKAIHGGDPSLDQLAFEVISAVSARVGTRGAPAGTEAEFAKVQERAKSLGFEFQRSAVEALLPSTGSTGGGIPHSRTYCVLFRGQRICITLPTPGIPPLEPR